MRPDDIDELFARNVHCILGLPFDNLDLDGIKNCIYHKIHSKKRCFLSTPNLNWFTTSAHNPAFRETVINSDYSIADGMPIIWMSKLLSNPINQRCAGSDLITAIEKNTGKDKVKTFFFGGVGNTGEVACEKINNKDCGLEAVGSFNPGFGSVEEMSTPEIIDTINSHHPDFVIVSLGAQKGQQWIERCFEKLNAPVVSHLGAVINFYAGSVQRSPEWASSWGLEWLWRIYQEPELYKRYWQDGMYLLKQAVIRLIPYWLFLKTNKPNLHQMHGEISPIQNESTYSIRLGGNFGVSNINTIKESFSTAAKSGLHIDIDFDDVGYIDDAFTGHLLLLRKCCNSLGKNLTLRNLPLKVKRILHYQNAEYLLTPY